MVSHKPARPRKKKAGLGCGFTAMVGLTCVVLLILNSLFLTAIAGETNPSRQPLAPFKFVGAVMMIFGEYWIYDRIKERFSRH